MGRRPPPPRLWLLAIPLLGFLELHVLARKKDFYRLLGVRHDVSDGDLQHAYHKAALKYHPDKNPGNEERAEAMVRVNRIIYRISTLLSCVDR